jgi:hypothetical protein
MADEDEPLPKFSRLWVPQGEQEEVEVDAFDRSAKLSPLLLTFPPLTLQRTPTSLELRLAAAVPSVPLPEDARFVRGAPPSLLAGSPFR